MLNHILTQAPSENPCVEGQIYKVMDLHGHSFLIRYGYYEECDRQNPAVEPMPIYPDFLREPRHTDEGAPFVTKMQDACLHYIGRELPEKDCAECMYYGHGEDLIGICTCPHNRKT